MVYNRFKGHRSYSGLAVSLGKIGVREKLEKFEWVGGVYKDGECIAGLWGDESINLVTRQGEEKAWLNLSVFRRFWRWFFIRHDKAVAVPDNGMIIPFLLRIGFKWENGKLVLHKSNLKAA